MLELTIRELECFVKVNETKSFVEASEELGLSQPTISIHISRMEKKLGTRLFHRSTSGAVLTNSGRKVYDRARLILSEMYEVENSVRELNSLKAGTLKIDASTIPGTYLIPHYLKVFASRFPEIKCKILIKDTEEVLKDIEKKSVDIGFIGYTPPGGIYSKEVFSDEIVIAVESSHRWAERNEGIKLEELLSEPLLIRESGSGTRKTFMRVIKNRSREKIKIHSVLGSSEAVKESVKAGLAPGIISSLAVKEDVIAGNIKVLTVKGISLERKFYLIAKSYNDLSLAAKEFVKTVNDTEF